MLALNLLNPGVGRFAHCPARLPTARCQRLPPAACLPLLSLRLKPPAALGTSPLDRVGVGVKSGATDDDAATGAIDEVDPARDVCARFCNDVQLYLDLSQRYVLRLGLPNMKSTNCFWTESCGFILLQKVSE